MFLAFLMLLLLSAFLLACAALVGFAERVISPQGGGSGGSGV